MDKWAFQRAHSWPDLELSSIRCEKSFSFPSRITVTACAAVNGCSPQHRRERFQEEKGFAACSGWSPGTLLWVCVHAGAPPSDSCSAWGTLWALCSRTPPMRHLFENRFPRGQFSSKFQRVDSQQSLPVWHHHNFCVITRLHVVSPTRMDLSPWLWGLGKDTTKSSFLHVLSPPHSCDCPDSSCPVFFRALLTSN